ncbi:hypothetical protein DFJ58DRAFT_787343 [Suillus subalutaceus]|uniref:uncharacterized protein n=1 Tax=Suillus subalutaceus TaxID=48586 RepID=UPI001B87C7DC|nr:uncharacterized protein DFJ58DRAFT_787343 [Suillus subalutaceus]KAG1854780.1 hypothetical protein DFJ58DRAFT_787343 [Suillus subalutaceus]
MSFTTPVPMAYPYSHYRPLPFALDPYAPQYNRERRERALALYPQQQPGGQPTPNALHAQEYNESPNQTRMMRDVLRTRMSEDEDFDTQFPFDGDMARKQAEIKRANRAIRDQDVRHHEATREWQNSAAFQAHLEEQRLFARRRLDAENFLRGTVDPVPVQDEPSLKDMISSHLMEQHRSEVRDTLQAILARLSERHYDQSSYRTSTRSRNIPGCHLCVRRCQFEEGPAPSQEGEGNVKEIADSDTQEEPSASPAQVASSLSQISSVTARLETLLAAFQFPAELDFSPALGTADVFALTYTPANAPVRAQEHALSLLFADLDNIPSFGSDVVRNTRRTVVTRVDQALEELDKGVEERRGRARAKADLVTMPVE